MCCQTVVAVFAADNHGEPSLELMRLMAQLVKAKSYNVPPKVTNKRKTQHQQNGGKEEEIFKARLPSFGPCR